MRTRFTRSVWICFLAIGAALSGCAVSALPGGTPSHASKLKRPLPKSTETGTLADDGRYLLSGDEQAMNCQKLTGRMQIRLLQLRDRHKDTSAMSASVGNAVRTVFGVETPAQNSEAARNRDLALLDAYNRRLAEKGCPTYDLTRELQSGNGSGAPPRPIIPAKAR